MPPSDFSGCENTGLQLAAEAGVDAIQAMTLTDEAVAELSRQSAEYMDSRQTIPTANSSYDRRLHALVGEFSWQDS